MKFKIRNTDWFKRREPTKEIKPVSVKVDSLQLIDNYKCDMEVLYDDGEVYILSGRVNSNDIKGTWTVHGINFNGLSVLADIIEE